MGWVGLVGFETGNRGSASDFGVSGLCRYFGSNTRLSKEAVKHESQNEQEVCDKLNEGLAKTANQCCLVFKRRLQSLFECFG